MYPGQPPDGSNGGVKNSNQAITAVDQVLHATDAMALLGAILGAPPSITAQDWAMEWTSAFGVDRQPHCGVEVARGTSRRPAPVSTVLEIDGSLPPLGRQLGLRQAISNLGESLQVRFQEPGPARRSGLPHGPPS